MKCEGCSYCLSCDYELTGKCRAKNEISVKSLRVTLDESRKARIQEVYVDNTAGAEYGDN